MAQNHFEDRARAKKVAALFQVARKYRLTAMQVATGIEVRKSLVTLANVREPSAETWRALVQAMASAEAQEATLVLSAAARYTGTAA